MRQPIAALTILLASSIPGTAGPTPAPSEFCMTAAGYYKKLLDAPMHNEQMTTTNLLTFALYRNDAAQRILTMAWAARCDLTPFMMTEMAHYESVMNQPGNK